MTALRLTLRPPRPTRIRPLGIVLAALVVSAGSYGVATLSGPRGGDARPVAPPQRAEVFAPGPTLVDPAGAADLAAIDTQIAVWGAKSAADARDDISAGNVGILYLGRGRLTGDAADYERALAAADRAVAANPVATGTRALKATVLQATHDFPAALALATAILDEEPRNVDALAVAGDAQLELGRLADAASTYARIGEILPGPALDARLARLAWLEGDGTAAVELARRARDAAAASVTSDPSFYEAQLGEIARASGKDDVARAAFDAALAIRPTNQLALLGRARLEAFSGNDQAAIATLQAAAAIAPRPETLALLTDLLARAGDAAGASAASETIRVIEQLGGTSAQLFDRQILVFELDHGAVTPAMLEHAKSAAAIRPDAAGLDLVAWAAYRLGDLPAAREASARAIATGSADARVLYHAGSIAIASGDVAGGQALVERAVGLGSALDPLDRDAAVALLGGG